MEYSLGRAWPALLSLWFAAIASPRGPVATIHPTIVSRRSSRTSSADLTSHSNPSEGVPGRSHPYAFLMSSHSFLIWGAHAGHLRKI